MPATGKKAARAAKGRDRVTSTTPATPGAQPEVPSMAGAKEAEENRTGREKLRVSLTIDAAS